MDATFLSYRREDSAGYAGRLRESLERRLGHDAVFRDVDTIEPGQDFVDAITARLRDCSVLVALIGREWLDARDSRGLRRLEQAHDYVRLEIAGALERPDVLVVPVLVEGVSAPGPEDLPESIRSLARRQAISLRDETWDADVDRLANVIRSAGPNRLVTESPRTKPNRAALIALAVILVLAAIAIGMFIRRGTRDAAERPGEEAPTERVEPAAQAVRPGEAYGVDVPRVAEVAYQNVVLTVVAVNVRPRVDHDLVRVRMQVINEGRNDVNFWDASFRLMAGSRQIAPNSGLNEVVPSRSIRWGIVSFEVPHATRKASLQVLLPNQTADIPLDLSPTSEPPADEKAEVADSLARALRRPVIREPRPLIDAGDLTFTLNRVSTRRFANTLRLFVAIRLVNEARYTAGGFNLLVRAVVDDESLAPVDSTTPALEAKTSGTLEYTFDLPPSARKAILRATWNDKTTDVPLDVR
jgi:hypothetical protein